MAILPAVPVSCMCKVSAMVPTVARPMTSRSADDIIILSPFGLITLSAVNRLLQYLVQSRTDRWYGLGFDVGVGILLRYGGRVCTLY